MNTKEIMARDVLTVSADASMTEAYRLMNEFRIRHLPVVDNRNKVVGILSDRDIQRAMQVKRLSAFEQQLHLDGSLVVEQFMSWPVYAISETTPVERVAEEMLSQKVSAFVVEDHLGNLRGIVTTDDLLKLFLKNTKSKESFGLRALSQYFTGPEAF